MFRIEKAVQDWKLELVQRQTMTSADIEELETHLRDEVDHLQATGLTEEEAFLIASRRIGDSDQVAGEFAKVNAMIIWRNRFFWMIAGILLTGIISPLARSSAESSLILLKNAHLPLSWFWTGVIVPLVSAAVLVAMGWGLYRLIPRSPSLWRTSTRGKVLLAVGLGLAVLVTRTVNILPMFMITKLSRPEDIGQFSLGRNYAGIVLSLLLPFFLAALLILLMPRRTRTA